MIEHAGGKAQEGEEGSHLIVVATQAAHLWQEVKDTVHNADTQVKGEFSLFASA
jgi:hypothetical protein